MKQKSVRFLSCVVALSALAGCDFSQKTVEQGSVFGPPIAVFIEPYLPMTVGGHEAVVKGFDECPRPGAIAEGVIWIPMTVVSRRSGSLPECVKFTPDRDQVDVVVTWLPVEGQETREPSRETWSVLRPAKNSAFLLKRQNGSYATLSGAMKKQ
jgi:hypothetical protein